MAPDQDRLGSGETLEEPLGHKPDLNVAQLVRTVNEALGRQGSWKERCRIPYAAGLLAGCGFDALGVARSMLRFFRWSAGTSGRGRRREVT